jgi:hypothetical protein
MSTIKVIRDYRCEEHGYFESRTPVCPYGCTEDVKVVFLKAPSLKSDRTKNIDKTARMLAHDFRASDIKTTREGEHQENFFLKNGAQTQQAAEHSSPVMWGNAGDQFNLNSAIKGTFADASLPINQIVPNQMPRPIIEARDNSKVEV